MLPRTSRIVLVAALCSVAAGLKIKSELEDLEKMKAKGTETGAAETTGAAEQASSSLMEAAPLRTCEGSFPENTGGLVPAVLKRVATAGKGSVAEESATAELAKMDCELNAATCCGIVEDGGKFYTATDCGTTTTAAQMDTCSGCGITFCEYTEAKREEAAATVTDLAAGDWSVMDTTVDGSGNTGIFEDLFVGAAKTKSTSTSMEAMVPGDGMYVGLDTDGTDTKLYACYAPGVSAADGCDEIATFTGDSCKALAFDGAAHDGGLAYVGCSSGSFHIVDLSTKESKTFSNTEFRPSGTGPASGVTKIAGKGATAITAGADGYIWFWDLASGASSVIGRPASGALSSMALTLFEGDADTPDAVLVTGTDDGHVIKWTISTKDKDYGAATVALEFWSNYDNGIVGDIAVDDGATMVAVAHESGYGVWSLADGTSIFADGTASASAVALADFGVNSGPAVVAASIGSTIQLVDLRTQMVLKEISSTSGKLGGLSLSIKNKGCIVWELATGSSSDKCTCQGLANYFDGGVARELDDYAQSFADYHECDMVSNKKCEDYTPGCPVGTCVVADGKCLSTAPTPAPTLYVKPTPAPTPAPTKWVAQKMWFENIPVIGSFLREIWDTALGMQIIGTLVRAINFFPEKAFNETKKQLEKVEPLTDAVKQVGDALLSKDESMMANQQAGLALNQQTEEAPSTALPVLGKDQAADIISDLKNALQ